jgi:intracellular multiplication protein IcmJ
MPDLALTFRRSASEARAAMVSDVLALAVFTRDAFTCRCCGFRSMKYQQVLLLEDDPFDFENMATACIFCHQCFDLESVARMRSGILIWLPELDQASLHHAARDLYLARVESRTSERARRILDRLMGRALSRRVEAGQRLGVDVKELQRPHTLELQPGMRLLPLDRRVLREFDLEFNQFMQIRAYWRAVATDTSYPWLARMEELLFTDEELRTWRSQDHVRPTHVDLAAELLREAGGFFQTCDALPVTAEIASEIAQTCALAAESLQHDLSDHALGAAITLLSSAAAVFRATDAALKPPRPELFDDLAGRLAAHPAGRMGGAVT